MRQVRRTLAVIAIRQPRRLLVNSRIYKNVNGMLASQSAFTLYNKQFRGVCGVGVDALHTHRPENKSTFNPLMAAKHMGLM